MVGPRGPSRRLVLGATAGLALGPRVQASTGRTPRRIVCLEWAAAEIVLALGVVPVAIGDVRGYRDWVVEPALPASVLDLGTRFEPNLELLRALAPDLVVATRGYGAGAALARRFAPVVEIAPHAAGAPPLDHIAAQARQVAVAIGREAMASTAIDGMRATLRDARARLAASVTDPVCVVSLFEGRMARVYGVGGLVGAVMEALGLRNAWTEPTPGWGFASVGIERLARLDPTARVVVIDPVPGSVRALLAASTLWASLPFVRAGRLGHVPPVWSFGGLAAAGRLATSLSDALDPR